MVPFSPKPTTVIVLTCIPHREGYYKQRFDVTRLCLASIVKHTDTPYDLMVFDNGSMPEVVDYLVQLRNEGVIQYLLLSQKNVGYGAALNIAFRCAPGEYIAYTDDDVFFYPNWLSEHLKVLNTFPKAALVSGQLVQGDFTHDAVPKVAAEHGIAISEFQVPREWTERWCRNMMIDPDEFLSRPAIQASKDYLLELDGVKAFAGARGYAFVFRRSLLDEMPPLWSDRVIGGEDAEWHRVANEKGYMRLSTFHRLTDHIGNVLDDSWIGEARKYGLSVDALTSDQLRRLNGGLRSWLGNKRPVRKLKRWVARKVVGWM